MTKRREVLLACLMILLTALPPGLCQQRCNCRNRTFEQHVNTAEILLRVTVLSKQVAGSPTTGYFFYSATVVDVFKGCNLDVGELVWLKSFISRDRCGVLLQNGEYLISATSTGEMRLGRRVLNLDRCRLNVRWQSLNARQKQHLCDSKEPCPRGPCEGLDRFNFGNCQQSLGWGILNGRCTQIRGCTDRGRNLYPTRDACTAACRRQCNDLSGWHFGLCQRVLGYGFVNGQCRAISGCSSGGLILFNSLGQCREACPAGRPFDDYCPRDLRQVRCTADPCRAAGSCPGSERCASNFCGGCHAVFFDEADNIVSCRASNDSNNNNNNNGDNGNNGEDGNNGDNGNTGEDGNNNGDNGDNGGNNGDDGGPRPA